MTNNPNANMPPMDPGNPFLAPYQAALWTDVVKLNGQPMVMCTMRVGPGTLTAFMMRSSALEWARTIRLTAEKCSDIIVPQNGGSAGAGLDLSQLKMPPPGPGNPLGGPGR